MIGALLFIGVTLAAVGLSVLLLSIHPYFD